MKFPDLLSYLFELFEQNELTKKDLLECYPLLVQCGVKYTHLASNLRKYLPIVVNIVHQEHPIRAQHHVVLTVYEFVKNVSSANFFAITPIHSFATACSWPQTIEF